MDLKINNITKLFGKQKALDQVSFSVIKANFWVYSAQMALGSPL
jgi:ABC-type uncharacterized transport system ATPase subunit